MRSQDIAEFAFYEFSVTSDVTEKPPPTSSSGFIENSAISEVAKSARRPTLNSEVAIG